MAGLACSAFRIRSWRAFHSATVALLASAAAHVILPVTLLRRSYIPLPIRINQRRGSIRTQ
jgi:hypothetical protein